MHTCKISGTDAGFFSMFRGTVSTIKYLVDNGYAPEVIWENTLYNDPEHGDNAWEYFFEQIVTNGTKVESEPKIKIPSPCPHKLMPREYSTRVAMYDTINRYVKLTPAINMKTHETYKKFKGYNMLGVHIRRTDKNNCTDHGEPESGKPVSLDLYDKHMREYLQKNENSRIFLATDDQEVQERFTDTYQELLYTTDSIRSAGNISVHHGMNEDKYQQAEDVLIDCLLLSTCNHLVKGISNVALCAMFFNVGLTATNLNSLYNGDTREDFVNE